MPVRCSRRYINDFLKAQKIPNQYSAENILEENITLILGMVWSLILRFNVQQISEGDRTAKEGLLLWAQNKVNEVSNGTIEIINFHTSWQDGMAFNALIQVPPQPLWPCDHRRVQSWAGRRRPR